MTNENSQLFTHQQVASVTSTTTTTTTTTTKVFRTVWFGKRQLIKPLHNFLSRKKNRQSFKSGCHYSHVGILTFLIMFEWIMKKKRIWNNLFHWINGILMSINFFFLSMFNIKHENDRVDIVWLCSVQLWSLNSSNQNFYYRQFALLGKNRRSFLLVTNCSVTVNWRHKSEKPCFKFHITYAHIATTVQWFLRIIVSICI